MPDDSHDEALVISLSITSLIPDRPSWIIEAQLTSSITLPSSKWGSTKNSSYCWTRHSWDLEALKSTRWDHYPTSGCWHLTTVQGDHLSSCWLLLCLQYHHRMTYALRLESSYLNLPLASKIPDKVWGGKSVRKPDGSLQDLCSYVGNGQTLVGFKHRRAMNHYGANGGLGWNLLGQKPP